MKTDLRSPIAKAMVAQIWVLGVVSLALVCGCTNSTAERTVESEGQTETISLETTNPEESESGGGSTTVVLPVQDDFGLPCESNADCQSGFCVPGVSGDICTQTCLENCPKGYACKAISNLGPDTVFICIPEAIVDPCEGKADGAVCDDGNPCVILQKCQAGECVGGQDLECEDDNPCTIGECNSKYGCTFNPLDGGPCEDDDVCTVGGICEDGTCIGADQIDCDDGDPCTENACDPIEGCIYPETDCDDGNPETLDVCLGEGCENIKTCDGLDHVNSLCSLLGSKGDIIPCEIRLASAESGVGQANSLQTSLKYSENIARPLFFSATAENSTPIGNGLNIPSGHTLTFGPSNLDMWTGEGELILISLGSPYPVSDAFLNGDVFEGSPTAVVLHFELKEDVPVPIPVVAMNTVAGDGNGAPLFYQIVFETIVTEAHTASCDINGAPCEDGNACTINEVCIAKVCAGEVRVCDDGNICTFDFCAPEVGCFHQVVEDDCPCHDQGVCTTSGSCISGECVVETLPDCSSP